MARNAVRRKLRLEPCLGRAAEQLLDRLFQHVHHARSSLELRAHGVRLPARNSRERDLRSSLRAKARRLSNGGIVERSLAAGPWARSRTGRPEVLTSCWEDSIPSTVPATLRSEISMAMAASILTGYADAISSFQGAPRSGCTLTPSLSTRNTCNSRERLQGLNPASIAPNTTAGNIRCTPLAVRTTYFSQDLALTKYHSSFAKMSGSSSRVSSSTCGTTRYGRTQRAAITAPARDSSRTPRRRSRAPHSVNRASCRPGPGQTGLGARQIEFRANIEF